MGVRISRSIIIAIFIFTIVIFSQFSHADNEEHKTSQPKTSRSLEIKASADRQKVAVGKTITVTITAKSLVEQDKHYNVLNVKFPNLKNLEIVDSSSSGRSIAVKGGILEEHIFKYILRPIEKGEAETGDIQVEYTVTAKPEPKQAPTDTTNNPNKKDEGEDKTLTRTLASIKFNVTKATFNNTILAIIIAAVIAIVIGILVVLVVVTKRTRVREAAAKEREVTEYIEDDFLQSLNGLQELKISGEIKSYCGRIIDLLSDYLNKKYKIDISSGSSSLDTAKEQIGVDIVSRIKEILFMSDQIRFAGYEPSSHELDRILNTVTDLLNKNRPAKKEAKPENEIELREE